MFFKGLLTALLFFCLFSCNDSKNQEDLFARPVITAEIISGANYKDRRAFSGTAIANTSVELSFRIPGMLEEMPVKVGQLIENGQRLARLDSTDYELNLISSLSKLEAAKAEKIKYLNEYERIKRLYEHDSASKKDLDSSRSAFKVSEANVGVASSEFEIAKNKLSYSVIYFDCEEYGACEEKCFVSKKNSELGQNIAAHQDIFTIDCFKKIEIETFVPDSFINNVKQNDNVLIAFASMDKKEKLSAKITEIEPTSSSKKSLYKVTAELEEYRENLRPGMNAEIYFLSEEDDDKFLYYAPHQAIAGEPNGASIYAFESTEGEFGIAKKISVEVIGRIGDFVKIKGDLYNVKEVIVAGLRYMENNRKVKKEQKVYIESIEVSK